MEGQDDGEPFLSGKLLVSEEILAKVFHRKYEPEYNADFLAKRLTTPLEWNDLVLPYHLKDDIHDIVCWINRQEEIRKRWRLDRIVK